MAYLPNVPYYEKCHRSNLMVVSEGCPQSTLSKALVLCIDLLLQNGKTSSDGWMSRPAQLSDKLSEG